MSLNVILYNIFLIKLNIYRFQQCYKPYIIKKLNYHWHKANSPPPTPSVCTDRKTKYHHLFGSPISVPLYSTWKNLRSHSSYSRGPIPSNPNAVIMKPMTISVHLDSHLQMHLALEQFFSPLWKRAQNHKPK